jgi:hypothetical protein
MQDNTVICQVKISRAAMKAAQEAAKAAKAPVKERKIIFFQSYLKASVVKLVLFLFNLSSTFRIISNSYFSEAQTLPPHRICPLFISIFCLQKRLSKGFSLLSGLFYNLLPL